MNNYHLRLPAEWESADAVLMAWPHEGTDWADMLEEIRACYANIIAALACRTRIIIIGPEEPESRFLPSGPDADNVIYINIPTNDTWTRDYGPITTIRTSEGSVSLVINDFKFNGWGLKFAADRDNLATRTLSEAGIFNGDYNNVLNFVLEGGSIESDGQGTLLTTEDCLLSPNRNGASSLSEIEDVLAANLGISHFLWLRHGALEGDDTDGHIDTLARLVPPGDTILYVGCNDPEDSHYQPLQLMLKDLRDLRTPEGNPYHLIELPLPDAVYDPEDGHRLPATYANFLIINDAVLLPVYGQPMKDMLAKMTVAAAFPGYEIIPVDCRALIRQHGSLHCATMQLPHGLLAF